MKFLHHLIQNLVRFCPFILKILSGNKILTSFDTKFGQILSIHSQDIDWKQNCDVHTKFWSDSINLYSIY